MPRTTDTPLSGRSQAQYTRQAVFAAQCSDSGRIRAAHGPNRRREGLVVVAVSVQHVVQGESPIHDVVRGRAPRSFCRLGILRDRPVSPPRNSWAKLRCDGSGCIRASRRRHFSSRHPGHSPCWQRCYRPCNRGAERTHVFRSMPMA